MFSINMRAGEEFIAENLRLKKQSNWKLSIF